MPLPGTYLFTVAVLVIGIHSCFSSAPPVVSDCVTKKTCFFQPNNCLETPGTFMQNTTCVIGATVEDNGDGTADVELFSFVGYIDGVNISTNGIFVAFGLSYDKWMGDDSVSSCVWSPTPLKAISNPTLILDYNSGHNHAGDYTHDNAWNQTTSVNEYNTFSCKYTRKIVADSPTAQYVYPLNEPYYFLITRGVASAEDSLPIVHSLSDSDNFPWVSTEKYYPIAPGNSAKYCMANGDHGWASTISRTMQYHLVYAHSGLMMLGFWVFIGTGILLGRYYKTFFHFYPKIAGMPLWFQLHRAIQVTGVALIVTSFICIFVSTGHLAEKSWGLTYQHMVLGMTSVILMVLIPLSAIARPHPEAPYRPLFKDFHFFFGFSAVALAFGAFIIACTGVSKGGLTYDPNNVNYMYAVVGLLGFINIFQTIYMRIYQAEQVKRDMKVLNEKIISFERPNCCSPWAWPLHAMTAVYTISTLSIAIYLIKVQADVGIHTLAMKFPD